LRGLLHKIQEFLEYPEIEQNIKEDCHEPDDHHIHPKGRDKCACNHFPGSIKMRLDKFIGGIQIDGVSFLNHIAFVFSKVIKGLVVGYKLFKGLIGTAALQLLKIFQIE